MNTRGNIISGIVATVITAGIAVGGVTAFNTVQADAAAHARYVATDHLYDAAMVASSTDDSKVQAAGVQAQHIATINAEVQAAEDAKAAAAAALAAQQAAAAAAAQQAAQQAAARQAQQAQQTQQTQQVSATSSSSSSASGAAAGTPLPMTTVTDPNNAQYGQQVPAVDPGSWCAAHSASTVNGVPTCD